MRIESLSVGPMDNNAYLLCSGDDVVLVDAATDAPALLGWIGERRVSTIVTTHRHHDHIGALAELAQATGARLVAGTPDADAIAAATGVRPQGVWDGDAIAVGHESARVIGLVGHTPGGIALACRDDDGADLLITGDSLFPGGVGKTHTSEFASLLDDVETKLFDRFTDARVLPGHGSPTTLADERPHLDAWRHRGW